MADWQVGDLALCVSYGPDPSDWLEGGAPRKGGVYTVKRASFYPEDENPAGVYLKFDEWDDEFHEWGFRNVTPPEADAFDLEVIEQMTGLPVEVGHG